MPHPLTPTPYKLTPRVIEMVAEGVSAGCTYEAVAKACGIGVTTFRRWRADAKTAAPGTLLADLHQALELADAEAEIALVAIIRKAAKKDWRAAGWLLCHRWPERWSKWRDMPERAEVARAK